MTPRSTSSAAEHRSEDAADPDQTDRPAKTSSAGQHAKRARPKPSDGAAADAGAAPRRVSPGGLDKMRLTGDLVLFIPQSGVEVEVDAETFLLLRERDVQAVASERVDPHAGQYL